MEKLSKLEIKAPMRLNGLLIDCSRLLEALPFYYRLLSFMADWQMNVLLMHFSDDSGLAVKLPGFGHLAMPHAFNVSEMKRMISFASALGIEVIPELETFAHSRYLTGNSRYSHLRAPQAAWVIDPLNPEARKLMGRLIAATAKLFPSRFIHLGCDEVHLEEYCKQKGLDADKVWSDYVNTMITNAKAVNKKPIIWADCLVHNDNIAGRIRKDVILAEWRYEADIEDTALPKLKRAGFSKFLVAPSVACWLYRFLPTDIALENTLRMARFGKKHRVMGLINTIWCPWRYLQNTLYYGIAFSSWTVKNRVSDKNKFHAEFARRVFGTNLKPALKTFLDSWTKLRIDHIISQKIYSRSKEFTRREIDHLRMVSRIGAKLFAVTDYYGPEKNRDIWLAMILAAKCAWICAESVLVPHLDKDNIERKASYNKLLIEIKRKMNVEWNNTRRPDDPQKTKALFKRDNYAYAMLLIRVLRRLQ